MFRTGLVIDVLINLESLMGTTHGAEELGLCSHGLACQARAWGRYIGFYLRYGHIWPKIKSGLAGKNILLHCIQVYHGTKGKKKKIEQQIGHLEKRLE